MNEASLLEQYEPKPGKLLECEHQLWQSRFSPCGKYLIACGYDSGVRRWAVSSDEVKPLTASGGHHGWVQCLTFHPSRGHVFTADSWGKLMCWPYADASPEPVWHHDRAHDGWIRALAISSDGSAIATAGNDRVVRIWSSKDGKLQAELPDHPSTIFSLVFSPDGTCIVSGDLNGSVRQWDIASRKMTRDFDASLLYKLNRLQDCGGVRHLAIDRQGKYLTCAGQREPGGGFAKGVPSLLVFDWKTAEQKQEMIVGGDQDGFVYDVQFHPAGFIIGTSCAFPGKGHLWFWNPGDEKPFYTSKKIPNGRSVSMHPDQRRLALTVSVSINANGRPKGDYIGGTSKIHLLELPGQVRATTDPVDGVPSGKNKRRVYSF